MTRKTKGVGHRTVAREEVVQQGHAARNVRWRWVNASEVLFLLFHNRFELSIIYTP